MPITGSSCKLLSVFLGSNVFLSLRCPSSNCSEMALSMPCSWSIGTQHSRTYAYQCMCQICQA